MSFFNTVRRQKLLSLSLLVFTLAVGIVIGTLITGDASAARDSSPAPDATPLVIPSPTQIQSEFAELAKRMEPTVVNISTDYMPKSRSKAKGPQSPDEEEPGEEGEEEDPMDLFRRFFRRGPGGGQMPSPRAFRREATGSGFIVDRNGYILTNYHVVDDADHIRVKMPHDRAEFRARLIGYDEETDLAVIKIDAGKALQPATIGNSDSVQVGHWVVAIGSPFGLEATVTAGIVSATGRDIEGAQQFQRFIQTDAAINPGNSGGPLLNIRGEVIGINTAIATQSGGYQGVGFALPMNAAVNVYNQIIRTGRVSRGSIGIRFSKYEDLPTILKGLGLQGGVIVETVIPGGPAEAAGIKAEDVIIAYNGKPVKDGDDLVSMVAQTPVGDQARVTVDRGGKRQDLTVTIADRNEQIASNGTQRRKPTNGGEETDKGDTPTQAKFGISIRSATQAERDTAQIKEPRGVVVTQVQENSFAEEAGVQEKDIILSINRNPVSSVDDVRKIQGMLKAGDAVAFRIMRPHPPLRSGQPGPYTSFYVSGTLPR